MLGIEAVGLVENAPGGEFKKDDVVATCMGGMGRDFDGGYAEFTCVPATQVQRIETPLSWEKLGALPEMMQTAWGCLFKSLKLMKNDHLLVRGGTTSVGLAAMAIAKSQCAFVAATTRKASRGNMLRGEGADDVFIDANDSIAEEVRSKHPQKFSKVLELVGATTLADSLQCVSDNGIVCIAGIAGGKWTFEDFNPMVNIPTSVCLTRYSSSPERFMATPLEGLAKEVADGSIRIPTRTFQLDQIVEAHRAMEDSTAAAKIVILM